MIHSTTPRPGPSPSFYPESEHPAAMNRVGHEPLISSSGGGDIVGSELDSDPWPNVPMQDSESSREGSVSLPPAELTELVDGLYEVLRGEARRQLSDRPLHTLQPTALLNEALVRFLSRKQRADLSEGELYTYVAKVMRTVLVDHARTKGSVKRGGHARRVPLEKVREPVYRGSDGEGILAVHDALDFLAKEEPEFAELAELRYFGRMTVPEVAAARGVPVSRVKVASQCLRRLLELDDDQR